MNPSEVHMSALVGLTGGQSGHCPPPLTSPAVDDNFLVNEKMFQPTLACKGNVPSTLAN